MSPGDKRKTPDTEWAASRLRCQTSLLCRKDSRTKNEYQEKILLLSFSMGVFHRSVLRMKHQRPHTMLSTQYLLHTAYLSRSA